MCQHLFFGHEFHIFGFYRSDGADFLFRNIFEYAAYDVCQPILEVLDGIATFDFADKHHAGIEWWAEQVVFQLVGINVDNKAVALRCKPDIAVHYLDEALCRKAFQYSAPLMGKLTVRYSRYGAGIGRIVSDISAYSFSKKRKV